MLNKKPQKIYLEDDLCFVNHSPPDWGGTSAAPQTKLFDGRRLFCKLVEIFSFNQTFAVYEFIKFHQLFLIQLNMGFSKILLKILIKTIQNHFTE